MTQTINDMLVLDANESEVLRQNILHPNFNDLNLLVKMFGKRTISVDDDGVWTVSIPNDKFDLTIQN